MMPRRTNWVYRVLAISSVLLLLDAVTSFPLPDATAESPSVDALGTINASEPLSADDREAEVFDIEDGVSSNEQTIQNDSGSNDKSDSSLPLPQPQQTVVRILPSVDSIIENEIWQYRYPPFFDNVVSQDDDLESSDNTAFGSARSSSFRLNRDTLPSYVIGILDPAELVDGLFHPSVRRDQGFGSSDPRSPGDVENIRAENTGFSTVPIGIPKVILDSDDRWVWSKTVLP